MGEGSNMERQQYFASLDFVPALIQAALEARDRKSTRLNSSHIH